MSYAQWIEVCRAYFILMLAHLAAFAIPVDLCFIEIKEILSMYVYLNICIKTI